MSGSYNFNFSKIFVTTRVGLKIAVKHEPIFFRKGWIFSETAESTILRLSAIESTRKIWSESEEISNTSFFF